MTLRMLVSCLLMATFSHKIKTNIRIKNIVGYDAADVGFVLIHGDVLPQNKNKHKNKKHYRT